MKITWLGQAGLLFEKNSKILIDPFFSDSVKKVNPKNYRRVPINKKYFDIKPDILIITHDHLDHLDPETLSVILEKYEDITVLAPYNAWNILRQYGYNHNYVMFNRHTVWTGNDGIIFKAVKAEHSDKTAIGAIISDGEKNYYVTVDTLYSTDVLGDINEKVDVVFLPVNGVGNNMNMADASNFAREINARKVIPIHFGMFDEIDPYKFICENRVIPKIYEEIEL